MTKKLSLSSILDKFKDAQNTEVKVAEEKPIESAKVAEEESAKVAEEESAKVAEEVTEPVTKIAADVLKDIAKEAADSERSAITKEASEFGKLFAHSFIEEVEMLGTVKQASENAYNATVEAIKDADMTEKLAAVFDEANLNTRLAVIERSAYSTTCQAMEKKASDDFNSQLPLMLLGATQEAYDNTVEALRNAR